MSEEIVTHSGESFQRLNSRRKCREWDIWCILLETKKKGADGSMRVIHFKHLFAEADNIKGDEKIKLASSQMCSFSG